MHNYDIILQFQSEAQGNHLISIEQLRGTFVADRMYWFPATPPRAASAASLVLARWHGAAGGMETALDLARAAGVRNPALAHDRRQALIEAQLLDRTGRRAEARALIDARIRGFDVSAALLRANTLEDDAARLAAVNAVLTRSGLSDIALRDPSAPLSLDNLRGAAGAGTTSGALVTVIVPVHDAEATLGARTTSRCTARERRWLVITS